MTRVGVLTPWLRTRRIDMALPHIHGRVLDYGCHVGILARHVPPERYLGVDIDEVAVAEAKLRHPDHRFLVLSDLDEADFDTIVALAVVEHLGEPDVFFRTAATWSVPRGRLVVTTPQARFDRVYHWGGRLGIFGLHDEHDSYMGRKELANVPAWSLTKYRRFLLGANQLAVYQRA